MMRIRPIASSDLDQLGNLALESGPGMTNLPADRAMLANKIESSLASFSKPVSEPGEEFYLFVLEELETGRIAGTSGIIACVGLTRPFYSYMVINVAHTSQELQRYEQLRVLQMVNEYRGTTEIATLYLTPDYRKDGNGRLLSRFRFLMLAEFPERFTKQVMAEMRGVSDETGHSIFWDSLGRHFFDMDFSKADFLSSLGKHQFIADLMPKFPIYVRLLPKAAQAVIGVTHAATRPALELLRREGFRFEGCVDVFDAGPTIHAPTEHIRTVSESRRSTIERIVDRMDATDMIICNTRADGFRGCRGKLRETASGSVWITHEVADALDLQLGDPLRYVRF